MSDTTAPPPSQRPAVLVASGDPEERDTMRRAIETLDCDVLPLDSLEHAVTLLQNNTPCDLVVLDVDTLHGDPSLFDNLLGARTPPTPTIVFGVDRQTKTALHCLNKGAVDFLAKPLDPAELANAAENILYAEADSTAIDFFPDAIAASRHVEGWIDINAASELDMFRRLQRFSDALFESRLPRNVCDDLKMAVEEVGRNAVEWGNKFDREKQLRLSYCLFDDRVVIKIEDEGEGFSPETLPDPTDDPAQILRERVAAGKRPGGYGVYMLGKLVDNVVYSEKGNTVLLIKYLPKEERDGGVGG